MTPSKLDLLAEWLPEQPWFALTGGGLSRAGGFRLDDPGGEVGIELMIVSMDDDAAYLVPMTYRGEPLDGADAALIGISEHGVLGSRWIYDGEHDPVLRTQLAALLRREVEPQAQRKSDTPDPTVLVRPGTADGPLRINRVLSDHDSVPGDVAYVSAIWQRRDGTTGRGIVATAG